MTEGTPDLAKTPASATKSANSESKKRSESREEFALHSLQDEHK